MEKRVIETLSSYSLQLAVYNYALTAFVYGMLVRAGVSVRKVQENLVVSGWP